MRVYRCDSCNREIENDERYRFALAFTFWKSLDSEYPSTLRRDYCVVCGRKVEGYIRRMGIKAECEEV